LRASLDGQTVPLPEMIRKMTSLAAEQFRLEKRGVLKKGCFADVVVFDPRTVQEKTSYADPHQLSEGVTTLVVNGVLTIAKRELTGQRNGQFLG
jgi:N-acyl-D-amino-acid deacylase